MKEALMEYETIDSNQVKDLINREKVRLPASWDDKSDGSSKPEVEETDLGEQSDSDDASGDKIDV
jgi:cell division protease FtsH